ncbi:Rne/Rng family ribonuclease [Serinicoccus sediminis]|uniref:Rne/Rng family ribonuclease n=1 Tax=Serinicoccus sediminis TaxID=2306021 RepID=UPI00307BA821
MSDERTSAAPTDEEHSPGPSDETVDAGGAQQQDATPQEAAEQDTPPADVPQEEAPQQAAEEEAPQQAAEEEAPQQDADEATEEEAAEEEEEQAPAAQPSFGLVFQAPDLTDLPRRRSRRATSASTAPAPAPEAGPATEREDTDHDDTDRGDTTPDGAGADDDRRGDADDDGDNGGRGRRRRRRGGKGRRSRAGEDGGPDQEPEGKGDADEEDRKPSNGDKPSGSSRRRRGGGGGKDSGSGQSDQKGGDARAEPGDQQRDAQESEDDGSGGTKRRRRRSRSGSERSAKDEVTSVKGSTRLEAKRQRRREGREAGRRRTVITEAEFLARRESVERVMVVRGLEDRTQIAVLEDGVPVEHYVSRSAQSTMVGNVYLGRVQNVLPSMEAAFVDIGKGRNAVLYAGEVNWDAAGLEGNQPKRIENALKSGESVLVQVTKDPIGHKGARLTSQVSLPGRYLVYVPGNSMTGISRKLPDTERNRLKKILKEVVPGDAGVIVRTAAEGASEAELRADVERLTAMWERIEKKSTTANAPSLLHGEADMTVRVIRDVFNEDFAKLVVSGDKAWTEVKRYIDEVAPDLADRVEKDTGTTDVFTTYRVHEAIAKAMDRKVWLPSGGSLVIDRTEAMTVVDVNTGKFTGSGGNLEETVTKNNIEAAEEIVRQLRLRDIGGIIVVDFIDMVLESNRDLVVRRLLECLGRDRTKHQVAEVTSLGLVQMTRKRVGSGLIEVFSESCTHCSGRGVVVQTEPVVRGSGDEGNGGNAGNGGGKRRGKGRGGNGGNGGSAEPKNVLPTPNPSGPTPAQIAAAAHAAALSAGASSEAADAAAGAAAHQVADRGPGAAQTPAAQPVPDPAPAAPEPETPAVPQQEPDAPAAPATAENRAPVAPVVDEPAPAPRRRRRGRVVAPAGPPVGEAATGATTVDDDAAEDTGTTPQEQAPDESAGTPS